MKYFEMSTVYCSYIPLTTMMSYNGKVICWDGDMFPEFIREYIRNETSWEEETIASATDMSRTQSEEGRYHIIEWIWQFVKDQDKHKMTTYIAFVSELSEQYRLYQRSEIIGDCKLEEVMSI